MEIDRCYIREHGEANADSCQPRHDWKVFRWLPRGHEVGHGSGRGCEDYEEPQELQARQGYYIFVLDKVRIHCRICVSFSPLQAVEQRKVDAP